MYLVEPNESSILMPNTNVYYGSLLNYAKSQKIKFKIIEGFETTKVKNYYKELIEDLYKKFPDNAKDIINRLIGTFNLGMSGSKEYVKFEKICNDDELNRSEGYYFKLNNKYNILYENKITNLQE
jgi:hypothetical protein